jgi:hypothetical protein
VGLLLHHLQPGMPRLLRPTPSRRRPPPSSSAGPRQPSRRHPPRLPRTPQSLRRERCLGPPKRESSLRRLTRCAPGVSNHTHTPAPRHQEASAATLLTAMVEAVGGADRVGRINGDVVAASIRRYASAAHGRTLCARSSRRGRLRLRRCGAMSERWIGQQFGRSHVLAVMIGVRGRLGVAPKASSGVVLRANGGRESCPASRFLGSSTLSSSRDVGFDVAEVDARQDAQRTRTGRTAS